MDWSSKMGIHIRGCLYKNWPQNYSECLDTWGKVMTNDGWRIKVVIGHPELDQTYKDSRDFFFVNTTDGMEGVFEKTIYASCKWLVEQEEKEWVFITDSDTFVHPVRFTNMLNELYQRYGNLDYVGAARPVWYNVNTAMDFSVSLNDKDTKEKLGKPILERVGGIYLSGGSGFILSKKSAQIIVDSWESKSYEQYPEFKEEFRYYDDCLTGLMLSHGGIDAIHTNAFQSTSPKINDIIGPPILGIEYDAGSFIAVQHYQYGEMERLAKILEI